MKKKNWSRFYELYKSDLSLAEIEKLVKSDVPGVYEFYARDMERPDHKQNWFIRSLVFARNFFLAFLLKLTAGRRLAYSLALFVFFYGLLVGLNQWILFGFLILNFLLALEVADKLVAKDELEVAREIQMGLMPKKALLNGNYDIACFSEPAREVGGDYYDFIKPRDQSGHTYIVVGDVKGKGMAAALYMVRIQALLQYLFERLNSPREVLITLNQNVSKILKKDYFISLSITKIHDEGEFIFCRAGHMPLIHYQAQVKKCRVVEPKGIAVGLENNGCFDRTIEEISLHPRSDDVLVYYTDGIVETMNVSGKQYGEDALMKIVGENSDKSSEEIKELVLADIARFRGNAPAHDDLTLLVMKMK